MTKSRDSKTHRAEPTKNHNIVVERVIKPKKSKKHRVELRKMQEVLELEYQQEVI